MTDGKKSLTEPPTNLKEAIDWLALVGGGYGGRGCGHTGMYDELGKALDSLKDFNVPEQKALKNVDIGGSIYRLAQRLASGFLGYGGQGVQSFDDKGIVQSNGSYTSAYANVEWQDGQKSEYVSIFLAASPFVFWSLSYLYLRCKDSRGWSAETLDSSISGIGSFMLKMGFTPTQLRNVNGSALAHILDSGYNAFEELAKAHGIYTLYDSFITTLEKNGPQNAIDRPLACSYLLSKYYCEYQKLQDGQGETMFSKIRNMLNALKSSCGHFSDIKSQITNFISTVMPEPSSSTTGNVVPSSPDGPVAGTLTTLGLGGGAAAVYLLDLGGTKTLVNGLLRTDRPSNLKEAIDWILRVTGKDGGQGGGGSGNETILAKAITELPDFGKVITAATEKLKESEGPDVSQALQKLQHEDTLKSVIGKLADGLKVFIGYNGGKGIANVIDPLQQLRKGVLMFLYEMVNKFKGSYSRNGFKDNDAVNEISKALSGTSDFNTAIDKVAKLDAGNSPVTNVVGALKNFGELKGQGDVQTFAPQVSKYLTEVLNAVKTLALGQVESLIASLPALVEAYGKQTDEIKQQIKKVEDDYKQLNHRSSSTIKDVLTSAVYYGTESLLNQLRKDGYKSSYISSSSWDGNDNKNRISQIFLGCLPLYYYWLTYLYWKCKQDRDKGGWATENLSRAGLISFMAGQGYVREHFNKQKRGSDIHKMLDSLGLSSATSTSTQPSHTDLLNELNKNLQSVIGSFGSTTSVSFNNHTLAALFYLCRTYFIGKQIMNPVIERRPPTSIREMLYWLSGLQFSPHYNSIKKQIEKHIPVEGLRVADSAMTTANNIITQNHMKGFLLSSCLSAPGVLGAIQGNTADTENEPWLYSLFCNSMNLQYPSGSALFNTLSNYAYSLQFQLHFLYRQCANSYTYTCGWNQCAFGANVDASIQSSIVASYICATGCTEDKHDQSRPQNCKHTGCGYGSASPLQAFLTDNLNGFCRQHPGTSKHLTECSLGSMCHVPMGFRPMQLKSSGLGEHIFYPLLVFCSSPSTPLRQLSEKLGCLTKRTPRTLGDLFGFMWHLNGQLFKNERPTLKAMIGKFDKAFNMNSDLANTFVNEPYSVLTKIWSKISELTSQSSQSASPTATVLSRSLEFMAPAIPFLYHIFMVKDADSMPVALFDLYQQCHKVETVNQGGQQKIVITHNSPSGHQCSTSPADLFSLQTSRCNNGQHCGPYLSPLNHTTGTAFAPIHASSYLSWVLYLTDDLEIGLQEMLDAFKNIDCQTSGCQKPCKSHHPGQHGTSADCSCPSVVQCAGVLPLYYEYGFTMFYASTLKTTAKRTCQQFHNQLKAVIKGNPVRTILTAIDDFLYLFRIYFFYNLSTFWILYVCIVLYIYFLRADLLHLKSHVHFPSSHGIPSISLFTTRRAPALKKFTKLTYFMP
ncbi:extracellular matrix-binding ebh [Babesia caballi]|uniref:Extracellular matrix-binding ebh n=1 Tax=Babesia caballi TaxID=5871 RepID=A0AAV4M1K5_BABCB|nr:extracellular matrix-binding ebh [Babesia caballi]